MKISPILRILALAFFALFGPYGPAGLRAESAGSLEQNAALLIRLRSAAATGEERVRLSDIASLMNTRAGGAAGEALMHRLSGIEVHRFAGDELEHRLSYDAIERAIRAEYAGPLVLVGSGLLVTRQVSHISRQQMLDAIQEYFKRNFSHAVFEVNPRSLPVTRTYFGEVSLAVAFGQDAASGPFTAELVAANGAREYERIPFDGAVRIPGRVLAAARDLAQGRTLRSGDVRFLELADVGRERILRFEELAGRRLLEDVALGERLFPEQFEKPLLVRRGMRVTVVWSREGVLIEAEAVAVDEGREGDVIRLKNPHSGREFSARVGEAPGRVYTDG